MRNVITCPRRHVRTRPASCLFQNFILIFQKGNLRTYCIHKVVNIVFCSQGQVTQKRIVRSEPESELDVKFSLV